ncbi:Hydroxyneurosporene synthase (CrtC) [Novymonas esmeraldas]|uniref:Hydroxyneurosporene synthase (CrtC) n=1 Tax=Novymonas esmeraldas TaxID=1808958 RepID=A0AAW0F8L3_9TRYP
MQFPLVGETVDEPPAQRQRVEDASGEEAALRQRLRDSWPQLSFSGGTDTGASVSASALRSMLFDHDRAHGDCLSERWTVRSRFGAHNRFGLVVTFHCVAVVSDVDPPKEDALLTHACVVNWSITDHEKKAYYRFCAADERAPSLFMTMIAKKTMRDQPAMLEAVLEQLNSDRLVLPDQLLDESASTRLTELDVQFGKNTLKSTVSAVSREHQLRVPTYTLHLEGVSSDHEEGDLSQEVRAVLDLTFMPRSIPPTLGGSRGVAGSGNWEEDEFTYCLHHTRLLGGSVRVTRASDDLELARDLEVKRGSVWMEHSFGGVVPRTVAEASFMRALRRRRIAEETESMVHDQCLLRLYDTDSYSLGVARVMAGGTRSVTRCTATVQSAVSKEAVQHSAGVSMTDEMEDSFLSAETGTVYPTRWRVECPTHDGGRVELRLAATLSNQEMTTCLAQPSVWEGTVTVSGTLIKKDGSTAEVCGDGFVTSRGRGKLQGEKAVFGMLHGIGSMAMQRAEVAAMASWEAIADGPGLAALAGVKVALRTQQFDLTPSQQVVLAALLGTYGYIFHHPQEVAQVRKALQWCYHRWVTFYGAGPISYRTLTLRAFMMQELRDVVRTKCSAWAPKNVQALDVAVPTSHLAGSAVADSGAFTLPARSLLLQPPSTLEIAQIKALMDGTWIMERDATEGSMNAVLMEQGVSVAWRSVSDKAVPTWHVHVNRGKDRLVVDEVTMLERRQFPIALDGTEWALDSVTRGSIKARSCILASGRELYMEMEVGDGIERVWYQFQNGGKTMVQNIFYFPTPTTAKPVAYCTRYFHIQLPLGSPTSTKK